MRNAAVGNYSGTLFKPSPKPGELKAMVARIRRDGNRLYYDICLSSYQLLEKLLYLLCWLLMISSEKNTSYLFNYLVM